jgi:hypothetical protein
LQAYDKTVVKSNKGANQMNRSAKVVQMIKEHPEHFDKMDCRPVKPMMLATISTN